MKKLKDYTDVIYSTRDFVVFVIIYDTATRKDVLFNCTIECAIEEYGEREVKRIIPEDNELVICI